MAETLCGANCAECGFFKDCKGCRGTGGNPFGGGCVAAAYIKVGKTAAFEAFKRELMAEINALAVPGLPVVNELFLLPGFYVNLGYPVPSGQTVKLLRDDKVYLGAQLPCLFDDGEGNGRCFGIVADTDFILICAYGDRGIDAEIVLFKHR